MKMQKLIAIACAGLMAATCFTGCGKKESVKITCADDILNGGYSVAVQEGTTGDQLATKTFTNSEVVRFKKTIDCGIDLKNGKVDAVVVDAMPAKKIVEQIDGLTILEEDLSTEEYAIAVRKGDTEMLDLINKTLKDIQANGTYDNIFNAFIADETVPMPERTPSTATEELVMGTNAEFEPFEYHGENNEVIGFDIEVAHEIADAAGKKLKVEDMNFDSLIPALQSGKVDFVVAGMTVDEERLKNVDFSDSYFNASQVIIVREDSLK